MQISGHQTGLCNYVIFWMRYSGTKNRNSLSWIYTLKTGSGSKALKKTRKSNQPDELAMYSEANPSANWDDFRHSNQGHDYKKTRLTAIHDQGGLCAYCEVHYSDKAE